MYTKKRKEATNERSSNHRNVDNGYVMRGEGFSQVVEGREENLNIKLGIYLHDLIYQSMGDIGS